MRRRIRGWRIPSEPRALCIDELSPTIEINLVDGNCRFGAGLELLSRLGNYAFGNSR
jgi:hypothetical protein